MVHPTAPSFPLLTGVFGCFLFLCHFFFPFGRGGSVLSCPVLSSLRSVFPPLCSLPVAETALATIRKYRYRGCPSIQRTRTCTYAHTQQQQNIQPLIQPLSLSLSLSLSLWLARALACRFVTYCIGSVECISLYRTHTPSTVLRASALVMDIASSDVSASQSNYS